MPRGNVHKPVAVMVSAMGTFVGYWMLAPVVLKVDGATSIGVDVGWMQERGCGDTK